MTLATTLATYSAVVALLTALGIEGMRRWGTRRLLDIPNERSSHTRPTPRGGGLPIIAVALGAWVWSQGIDGILGGSGILVLVLGAVIVALVSWIDDLQGLSFRQRLGAHLLAGTLVLWNAPPPASVFLPWIGELPLGLLAWPLALVWIAGLTNAFNFMDGIDGIAGMQALFICAVAGWLLWPHAATLAGLLWIVAAAAAGFLMWNWAPARIFMGDVGSGFLGFLIAAIAFLTIARGLISLPVWVILWTLFLADTGVALTRRVLRGERWWTAHRSHAYQQLSRQWGSHAKVVITYAVLDLLIIMPGAWFAHTHAGASWWLCAALLGIGAGFAYSCNAWSAPNN